MSAREVPSCSYTWMIPSIPQSKQLLLCSGYCRRNNTSSYKIPLQITKLFGQYFSPNDEYTLDKIKDCPKGSKFTSKVFSIHGIKYVLRIYPNGYVGKPNGGKVLLKVQALSTLHNYQSIIYRIKINLIETNTSFTCTHNFKNCAACSWTNGMLTSDEIQNLNQMSMVLDFQFIELMDNNGCNIISQQMMLRIQNIKQQRQLKWEEAQLNWDQISLKNLYKNTDEYGQYDGNHMMKAKEHCDRSIEVKHWLRNTVKLPEYFDLFMVHGIEDMLTAKLMSMETLNEMGVKKIGHRLKLMHFVEILRNKDCGDGNNRNKNNKSSFIGNKRKLNEIVSHNPLPLKRQKLDNM